MADATDGQFGRLDFRDGTVEHMDDATLTRVVYALTTLALHDAIKHVHITKAQNAKGQTLWVHPVME